MFNYLITQKNDRVSNIEFTRFYTGSIIFHTGLIYGNLIDQYKNWESKGW